MASLGELFIELGVVGDVKPLEKAIGTMKEAVKQIDNEIKANQRLLKYLQDIKNARNDSEKALIKENFANEIKKQKMLDEIDANQKAVDGKKALASNIAGVVKGVGALVGALTGAAIALNKFTNDLVETNQVMLDLTRTSDIALGTFQKWGNIGKMLGVNNVEQQLEGLNQRMFDLMLTGEGARGFQLAGINPVGQDAEGVLEQLRARVSRMNDTTATYLLQQMGLDPRMLHLLRMSRDEFEELGKTIKRYQLTDDQTKQIQAMNIQLQIAGIKLRYLKDRAILALMPAWTQFMASLARVAEGLGRIVKWLTETNTGAIVLAGTIIGVLIPAIKLLYATITAHPIVATITAILGALYLLIDDIMAYFKGGRSGIGYLIKYFNDLSKDLEKNDFGSAFEKAIKPITALSKITFPWADQLILAARAVEIFQKYFNQIDNKVSDDGVVTGGAPRIGYIGELPNLDNMLVSPAMQRNVNNSSTTTNTDNRQIAMTNYIQTSQPVTDIQNQLAYARNAMASGWA